MASPSVGEISRQLGQLFSASSAVGLTDGELIERFTDRRGESAEAAFETILARHGGLVWTVCRQVLGDAHAAEDAFQATFLVLVHRAASLRVREQGSLGPWLYGVAYRIALKGCQAAARRRTRERRAATAAVETPSDAIEHDELHALLHVEVNRLPAKYRAPVVLCYFEGRTHEEAAAALQWPVGTVRSRLSRARDRLRTRLTRRGLAPAGWIAATAVETVARAEAEVPAALRTATVATAMGATPATAVAVLAKLMLRSLLAARVKAAAAALSLVLMTAGLGFVLRDVLAAAQRPNSAPVAVARVPSTPLDRFGDPLPKYARARMGTVRFNDGAFVVSQALYTPDGKALVTVSLNRAVHVWDAATGRIVRTIGNPENQFREIAISADGEALATIEEHPGRLRLWDLASGRERRRWHGREETNYHHLTFSPDGKTVAAATTWYNDVFLNLWDTTAPTERRRRIEGGRVDLRDITFAPDGRTLATASHHSSRLTGADRDTGSIQLWDIASARELRRFPIEGFGGRAVAFSRDGQRLFAGVTDRTIRVYDLANGREITPRLGQEHAIPPGVKGDSSPVCLEFSPDGSILASTTRGTAAAGLRALAEIHLWDVVRGTESRRIPAHGQWISSLSFAPDGMTIASTGVEPVIRLWDVATGRAASPQAGHRSGVYRPMVSPADGTLLTSSSDGTIRRWELSTGRELGFVADSLDVASALAMSPDGQTLVVQDGMGHGIFLWSVAERRVIRRFPRVPAAERNYLTSAAFSADGTLVAAELRVWDVASGRVLATFRDQQGANDFTASSIPIFPTPDGRQVITAEDEGIRIWEITSGKEVRWAVRSKIHNKAAALSPDGRLLATGGRVVRGDEPRGEFDPAIRIWELASGKEVATLEGHEESTHGLAFSPDGKLLASCSGGSEMINDQTVRLWDLTTGREQRRFEGHVGTVNAVAFAPDGRSIVSGAEDATALVWDVSDVKDHSKFDEPLTPESLQARWDELAGNDARAAYRAAWSLSVPSAVGFLRDHLRVATKAETITSPEALRSLRAITALEHVHTPEARAVIDRLTQGAPDAIPTREAKATLERLNRAMGR